MVQPATARHSAARRARREQRALERADLARWEKVAALVEAYTGVDERRAETLATGLLTSATEVRS
jgi:hypothetical protein